MSDKEMNILIDRMSEKTQEIVEREVSSLARMVAESFTKEREYTDRCFTEQRQAFTSDMNELRNELRNEFTTKINELREEMHGEFIELRYTLKHRDEEYHNRLVALERA